MSSKTAAYAVLSLLAAACAGPQSSVAPAPLPAATGNITKTAETATVHIIWPCNSFQKSLHETFGAGRRVKIDGEPRHVISACGHHRFNAAPGTHQLRLADPDLDFTHPSVDGRTFTFVDGRDHYFKVQSVGSGYFVLFELDPERGRAEIAALDKEGP